MPNNSYQQQQRDNQQMNEGGIEFNRDDLSDNDLFSLNDKSRANRINEWQAAWNVTNAIQVK